MVCHARLQLALSRRSLFGSFWWCSGHVRGTQSLVSLKHLFLAQSKYPGTHSPNSSSWSRIGSLDVTFSQEQALYKPCPEPSCACSDSATPTGPLHEQLQPPFAQVIRPFQIHPNGRDKGRNQ
jgi:hypothetical protein